MGRPAVNLVGKRFGKLVVTIRVAPTNKGARWEAICDCGRTTRVDSSNLRAGNTISCGCMQGAHTGNRNNLSTSTTYISWQGMWARCTDETYHSYHRYGGRGIWICDEWKDFLRFYEDMGMRPDGMWLERKDNDGGYFKDNCCWATPKEQAANRGGKFQCQGG